MVCVCVCVRVCVSISILQVLETIALLPHAESHTVVHGWLAKLNSGGVPTDANDWRQRLCLCVDGVWSLISEKHAGQAVKVCVHTYIHMYVRMYVFVCTCVYM